MNTVIDWLFANIIGENAIFLGLIALCGLLLQKKNARETFIGVIKTILGYYIFTSGSICEGQHHHNFVRIASVRELEGIGHSADLLKSQLLI